MSLTALLFVLNYLAAQTLYGFDALADAASTKSESSLANLRIGVRYLYRIDSLDKRES